MDDLTGIREEASLLERALVKALQEAEVGLRFAGADRADAESDFVSTPALALRAVRHALALASAHYEPKPSERRSPQRQDDGSATGPAAPGVKPPLLSSVEQPDSRAEGSASCNTRDELVSSLKSQVRKLTEERETLAQLADERAERMGDLFHQLSEARAALQPFASTPMPPNVKPHWPINYNCVRATYRDVVRARQALSLSVGEEQQQNQQLGSSRDLSHTASVKLKGGE